MLTREQLLAFRPASREAFIPEWNMNVRMQEWTVARRLEMIEVLRVNTEQVEAYEANEKLPIEERAAMVKVDKLDPSLVMILHSIVDEDDKPLLTMDDYHIFLTMAFKTSVKLYDALAAASVDDTPAGIEAEKKAPQKPGTPVHLPARACARQNRPATNRRTQSG